MAIAAIGCWSSESLSKAPPTPTTEPPASRELTRTSPPSIADVADINDVLLLRPEETSDGPRGLSLIDADTGRMLNFLPLDTAPMVTRRLSGSEVVVSDTTVRTRPDGSHEAVSSVKVFDAALSTLKRELPLAGRRISYKVYAPAMEVSPDEQALWYVATGVRDAVECAGSS